MNRYTTSAKSVSYVRFRRTQSGVLALGVAGIALLVFALIAVIAFTWNFAMAIYYQGKIAYVADQAAHYAAAQYCWYQQVNPNGISGAQTPTQTMVSRLLTGMGLPNGTVTVSLSSDSQYVLANLQVSGMVLPGQGNLPGIINLQATGQTNLSGDQPPGLAYFTFANDPNKTTAVCPCWGWYVLWISGGPPPANPLDVNIEKCWDSMYYGIEYSLPSGISITPGPNTPLPPTTQPTKS
jgi:hypothetical protein